MIGLEQYLSMSFKLLIKEKLKLFFIRKLSTELFLLTYDKGFLKQDDLKLIKFFATELETATPPSFLHKLYNSFVDQLAPEIPPEDFADVLVLRAANAPPYEGAADAPGEFATTRDEGLLNRYRLASYYINNPSPDLFQEGPALKEDADDCYLKLDFIKEYISFLRTINQVNPYGVNTGSDKILKATAAATDLLVTFVPTSISYPLEYNALDFGPAGINISAGKLPYYSNCKKNSDCKSNKCGGRATDPKRCYGNDVVTGAPIAATLRNQTPNLNWLHAYERSSVYNKFPGLHDPAAKLDKSSVALNQLFSADIIKNPPGLDGAFISYPYFWRHLGQPIALASIFGTDPKKIVLTQTKNKAAAVVEYGKLENSRASFASWKGSGKKPPSSDQLPLYYKCFYDDRAIVFRENTYSLFKEDPSALGGFLPGVPADQHGAAGVLPHTVSPEGRVDKVNYDVNAWDRILDSGPHIEVFFKLEEPNPGSGLVVSKAYQDVLDKRPKNEQISFSSTWTSDPKDLKAVHQNPPRTQYLSFRDLLFKLSALWRDWFDHEALLKKSKGKEAYFYDPLEPGWTGGAPYASPENFFKLFKLHLGVRLVVPFAAGFNLEHVLNTRFANRQYEATAVGKNPGPDVGLEKTYFDLFQFESKDAPGYGADAGSPYLRDNLLYDPASGVNFDGYAVSLQTPGAGGAKEYLAPVDDKQKSWPWDLSGLKYLSELVPVVSSAHKNKTFVYQFLFNVAAAQAGAAKPLEGTFMTYSRNVIPIVEKTIEIKQGDKQGDFNLGNLLASVNTIPRNFSNKHDFGKGAKHKLDEAIASGPYHATWYDKEEMRYYLPGPGRYRHPTYDLIIGGGGKTYHTEQHHQGGTTDVVLPHGPETAIITGQKELDVAINDEVIAPNLKGLILSLSSAPEYDTLRGFINHYQPLSPTNTFILNKEGYRNILQTTEFQDIDYWITADPAQSTSELAYFKVGSSDFGPGKPFASQAEYDANKVSFVPAPGEDVDKSNLLGYLAADPPGYPPGFYTNRDKYNEKLKELEKNIDESLYKLINTLE